MAYFFNLNKFQGFPKKQKQLSMHKGSGGGLSKTHFCVFKLINTFCESYNVQYRYLKF